MSQVAHHTDTVMIPVVEMMVVNHRPKMTINNDWVGAAVNIVMTCNHWDLILVNQPVANRQDQDILVMIIVVAYDMMIDNWVDHLIIDKANLGLIQGLDPPQITWVKWDYIAWHT